MAGSDDEDGWKRPAGGEAVSRGRQWAGAAVHAFTASGVCCALMATLAVSAGAYERCFAWLGLALLIDGIDGTFARMVDVKRVVPRFSGERLDNVVDYVTYVFVPVLALLHSGYLVGTAGAILAMLILMSSLYHFSDEASKAADHCFVGFPAIWNVIAFYLFALPMPKWLGMVLILVCIGLTFVPMRWLHPMRVAKNIWLNLGATGLWLLAAAQTIWVGFPSNVFAASILVAVGAYSLWLTLTWTRVEIGR